MKMGRRFNRGGSIVNKQVLLDRLESCKLEHPTIDEIVEHLRSNFAEYSRIKLQPFTKCVKDNLNNNKKKRPIMKHSSENEDEEEGGTSRSGSRKKLKRIDENEAKLQRMEQLRLKRRPQGEPQTTSSESDSDEGDSDDDEDGMVSTSEDAVYGEKVEPEFDLMKSMLRASYIKEAKTKPTKEASLEKNIEMEVGNNNNNNNNNKGKGLGSVSNGGGTMEVMKGKEKEGPMFKDLGGMKQVLEELKMEVLVPLYHPELPRWLGVRPMQGILLHGPPGCGKTKLAHAIANETGVPFYKISATEVVSGVSGASEENIRELFSKAYRTAPSIVFIDEIDAIASKRENLQREMERRIVTQLMTCMDESHRFVQPEDNTSNPESSGHRPGYVLVIGATNRPDAVDSALRRPGRFDREIVLGVPDESARAEILSKLTHNLRVEGSFDLLRIARSTPGFVGADLDALVNKAGNLAMKRIIGQRKSELSRDSVNEEYTDEWWKQKWLPEEMEKLTIIMDDFQEAAKMVQPSSRREGFSSIPNVKWEDVGGLDFLRKDFDRYIVRRIKFPEDYEGFGMDLETGFLLYGPPGCGKTLIAKAVANEAGANFIHIKGPELLNKYVGESELAVRTLFTRARTCSPCILFFDEVDALTTKRGKEGGWVIERLLNQLLIELDGADQRRGVFVIGATNRPEVMDRAILRPGRFGKLLYVPLPSPDERGLILKALARKKPIDASVDLNAIGRMEACENLSGADLAALMNEAAMAAFEEILAAESTLDGAPSTISSSLNDTSSPCKSNVEGEDLGSKLTGYVCDLPIKKRCITTKHFEQALAKISPSVSEQQKQYYQILSERLKA